MQRTRDKGLYEQLTREVITASSTAEIVATIVGTILVVTVINFAALWYLDSFPQNLGYVVIDEKWSLLSSMEAPADWLIIGDSSCNQGVVPEILEEKLGGTAVNLCTIGNMGLLGDAWLLHQHVARLGPPANVVIVHVYNIWRRGVPPPALLAQIPLPWGFWEEGQPPIVLSPKAGIEVLLARYVPLIAQTEALKAALKSPLELFSKKKLMFETDGYMPVSTANVGAVQGDLASHLRFVAENQFSVSDTNQQALSEIISLADRYGADVYITNSPLYEGLLGDNSFREYYADLQKFLSDVADQSTSVHYLDQTVAFRMDQMDRVDHLIHPAAQSYTRELAEQIANTGAPRLGSDNQR